LHPPTPNEALSFDPSYKLVQAGRSVWFIAFFLAPELVDQEFQFIQLFHLPLVSGLLPSFLSLLTLIIINDFIYKTSVF